jgi:protoporphyrinogen oxidase
MKTAIVLGGGISGLSAAWQLSLHRLYRVCLYEKAQSIGGLCGFYDFDGMRLDYGPHKLYSIHPEIMQAFKDLGGDSLKELIKKQRIVLRGRFLDYPVKLGQLLPLFSLDEKIALGISVLTTLIKPEFLKKGDSYERYCKDVFGNKIYEIVFRPLAEKTWGDPHTLSADMAKRRIPTKNMLELILRLLKLKKESKLTNAELILYPYRGFYDFCESTARRIQELGGNIRLNRRPVKFLIQDKRVKTVIFDDASQEECDLLISSIPLNELFRLLFPQEENIPEQANFFQMRHSIIVYVLLNKPRAINEQWVFCADKDLIFSRISEQKNSSNHGLPEDKTVVCCDFTSAEDDPVWNAPDAVITERCIQGLQKLKVLTQDQVLETRVVRIPNFYPRYEVNFEGKRKILFEKINRIENVICTGRLGLADYCNVDHCLEMAIFIAERLLRKEQPTLINTGLLEHAQSFRIVD